MERTTKGLTAREREVLAAYTRTGSQKEAGASLGITTHTVRAHLRKARERAGDVSTLQLVDLVAREDRS
jgi:DNA-binding CsgD family transcriptional regulator